MVSVSLLDIHRLRIFCRCLRLVDVDADGIDLGGIRHAVVLGRNALDAVGAGEGRALHLELGAVVARLCERALGTVETWLSSETV